MFETGVPTFLGLAACEWEALSLGIDGALDGDTDWQTSLSKMKGGNQDASYQTCSEEIHYFRFGFSVVRYCQTHWIIIAGAIGGAAAGVLWIKTNVFGA